MAPSSPVAGASVIEASNNEYIYPKIVSNNMIQDLYIKKVTLDQQYTILDMVSYNGAQYQKLSTGEEFYLAMEWTKNTV